MAKITKININGVLYDVGPDIPNVPDITISTNLPSDTEGDNGDLWFTSGAFNLFTPVTVTSSAAAISEPGLYMVALGTNYSIGFIYINNVGAAAYSNSIRVTSSTEGYASYSSSTKKITSYSSSYPLVKCWKVAGV